MLSKAQIKLITSLSQKKFRQQHNLFIAEGNKTINELLNSDYELYQVYTITNNFKVSDALVTKITSKELERISSLKTPNNALALFRIKKPDEISFNELIVALDGINDPGNLGTIIRLCDWFGIKDLVCSLITVDCYNPKVIQATMGSLGRVNINYLDLPSFLAPHKILKYGAFMDGENVYNCELEQSGILVLGNEANGISESVSQMLDKRLSIPRFGDLKQTESLNVANATAILLSEFKRRTTEK